VIDVTPTPNLTIFSSSTIGYEDDQIILQVGGAAYYEWDNGIFDSTRIIKVTSVSQTICVTGFNSPVCFADTCVQIDVKPGVNVFVPNTFTPNNDGINDCFIPIVIDVSEENYLFQVYNKWGEEVFSTTEFNKCWKGSSAGQPSESDIYVWKVSFMDLRNKERFVKKGHVLLNR
jgi:gliding motility-associated-like protein